MDAASSAIPMPAEALSTLTPESQAYIRRLAAFRAKSRWNDISKSRQAAVLVLLFEVPAHPAAADAICSAASTSATAPTPTPTAPTELRFLLTTRALHLRSHPGQTALPGGRVDEEDGSYRITARREAFEEVGLPLDLPDLHYVTTWHPFLSKSSLIVTPVIYLLTNPQEHVAKLRASPAEVSKIFSHPLSAVVVNEAPAHLAPLLSDPETCDPHRPPQVAYRTYSDVPWIAGRPYRLHRIRSEGDLIKGMTFDVLASIASFAFGPNKTPPFRLTARRQMGWDEMCEWIVRGGRIAGRAGDEKEEGEPNQQQKQQQQQAMSHGYETFVGGVDDADEGLDDDDDDDVDVADPPIAGAGALAEEAPVAVRA